MITKKTISPIFRRFGMCALAGAMAVAPLAMPALAATGGGEVPVPIGSEREAATLDHALAGASGSRKLTVTNVNAGATYRFYRLLNLAVGADGDGQAVSWTYSIPDAEGGPAIRTAVEDILKNNSRFRYGEDYNGKTNDVGFKLDGSTVTFARSELTQGTDESDDAFNAKVAEQTARVAETMYAFADALQDRVDVDKLAAEFTVKPSDINGTVANGDTITFSGLDEGYWMVATDAGTRAVIFASDGRDATMANKNPAPTLEKFVWDADDTVANAEGTVLRFAECLETDCAAGHTWFKPGAEPGTGILAKEGDKGAVKGHLGKYEEDNDLGVNGETKFRIDVDAKSGARHLMVVDTLDEGLEFSGELSAVIFYPRKNASELGRLVRADTDKNADGKVDENDKTDRIELYREGSDKAEKAGRSEYTLETKTVDGKTQLTIKFKPGFLDPSDTDNHAMADVYKGDPSTIADDGGKIEIVYSAKLKDTGVRKNVSRFVNKAELKYSGEAGDSPSKWLDANEDATTTYTYELDLLKSVTGSPDEVLPGARFSLYRVTFNAHAQNYKNGRIQITKAKKEDVGKFDAWIEGGAKGTDTDADGVSDSWKDGKGVMYFELAQEGGKTSPAVYVPVVSDGTEPTAEQKAKWTREIVTPDSGKVVIRGLDAGLYAIGETRAPEGFNKLDSSVMAIIGDTVINEGGKVFVPESEGSTKFKPLATSPEVRIENASGVRLPTTGGIGTVPFYVAGGSLVIGAGALLVARKRRVDGE